MSKRTVELELATPGLDRRGQPTRVPLTAAPGEGAAAGGDGPDLPADMKERLRRGERGTLRHSE